MDINDVCDYIILKVNRAGESLNNIKLQKLLYYTQAWHLAFYDTKFFENRFQAWIHGPVNREIYDRFVATKSLYSDITEDDIREGFDLGKLKEEEIHHIDKIIYAYINFSGPQLEEMTHRETPWIKAREGYRPTQRCEDYINENLMRDYYKERLQKK